MSAPKQLVLATSWRSAALVLAMALVSTAALACSYGDMVVHPKSGKIYIQRRDLFLFGALRKLYECTPDGAGHIACVQLDNRP